LGRYWLLLVLMASMVTAQGPEGSGSGAATKLTIDQVRALAHEHNRDYLSAREEVTKAQGEIGSARAGALPQISLNSYYSRNLKLAPLYFEQDNEIQKLQFGFKNSFGASISLYQPLWEGGKVFAAYTIARQYKKYAQAGADRAAAEVTYQSDVLFYAAILSRAQLAVLQQAWETFTHNLEVVEKLHSQGMVSRFELLRARVEKANLEPQIVAAESGVALSEKALKSFLGLDLELPISLIEDNVDTPHAPLPALAVLSDSALTLRPEMTQLDLLVSMREKAIGIARAGYFPAIGAVSQYGWQSESDDFTLDGNTSESWTAGLTLSMSLFDGGRTRSAVSIAKAEHRQATLTRQNAVDQIKLDVEQAYDRVLQAERALEAQAGTISQAEEGLRIANLRYEAGEGTLLEVLSAQTALTQARTSLVEATFALREAWASLRKATAMNL
jgi:outer membrane protein TolC